MAQGCYTPPYLIGSFKGVTFKSEEVTSEHGRRGAEGEFPFGETTAYADLGRKIRRYSISARYDGNNHVLQAALLIAACESAGGGVLTHPTRGVILSAACTDLKVRDRVEDEQGVTYVDMDFVEANEWGNGLSLLGTILGIALSPLLNTSRASFNSNYVVSNAQPFRREAVVNVAQAQVQNITNEYAAATAAMGSDLSRARIIYDLNSVVNSDVVATDTTTADKAITLGMNAIALQLEKTNKFDTFRRIANNATAASTFANPAALVENAIYSHVRVTAAAYMVEGALADVSSRVAVVFERIDVINNLIEQEIQYARSICDNELHLALDAFRTDALAQLYSHAYNAPALISYNFSGSVHPVVAAWSIYGDAKKHRDLEQWNQLGITGRMGPTVAAERGA